MQQPRAVIVGTGHSGSRYIARVLGASGLRAGHEGWFNPKDVWRPDLDVDSSWLATASLDSYEGIVWHQVREPLATITSMAFAGSWRGDYFQHRKKMMREVTDDSTLNAMIAYVDLNLKADKHATKRWRVEDVDGFLVAELHQRLGLRPDWGRINKALDRANSTENTHWGSTPMSWDMLPKHPVKQELVEMAERYGYEA